MATIEVWDTWDIGVTLKPSDVRVPIGRADDNALVLPHDQISRQHCVLERDGGQVRVRDLSRLGTTRNGQRLPRDLPLPVEPGDVLGIGPYRVTVHVGPRDRETRPTSDLPLSEIPGPHHAAEVPTRFGEIVGTSGALAPVLQQLHLLAEHTATVLLTGESGTGKELAARGLHLLGPRRDGPFVPLNAAAIPEPLFESQLFGHERGAFTGAEVRADGAFRAAHRGTLFLDEIGELPVSLQARLLRVLASGEVRRVGGTQTDQPDVRVVVATNRDLPRMCEAGTFRHDLFHRLAVCRVHLPPLRDRHGDVPLLANVLARAQDPPTRLRSDAIRRLQLHGWPGNVRELRNVVTRAAIAAGGGPIRAEHIVFDTSPPPAPPRPADAEIRAMYLRIGSLRGTAAALGIPRTTLRRYLQRLGLLPARAT